MALVSFPPKSGLHVLYERSGKQISDLLPGYHYEMRITLWHLDATEPESWSTSCADWQT